MSLEQYVVRTAEGGLHTDLVWVAEVDYDAQAERDPRGEVRWAGGLEGLVEPIVSRADLGQRLAAFRHDGHQVDRLP